MDSFCCKWHIVEEEVMTSPFNLLVMLDAGHICLSSNFFVLYMSEYMSE